MCVCANSTLGKRLPASVIDALLVDTRALDSRDKAFLNLLRAYFTVNITKDVKFIMAKLGKTLMKVVCNKSRNDKKL